MRQVLRLVEVAIFDGFQRVTAAKMCDSEMSLQNTTIELGNSDPMDRAGA